MNKCLVMVDLQNDYFPGGKMELTGIEDAAENARILLTEFRKKKLPIIHLQHISVAPNAFFFLPGTDGAKINDGVTPREGETVVVKNLVICGAMSHMCIDATTRAAFDLGFNCVVAEDACTTKDLFFNNKIIKASEVHASFMAALSFPYAKVVLTRDIVKDMA
jgi:nicotinamidase-related amidase